MNTPLRILALASITAWSFGCPSDPVPGDPQADADVVEPDSGDTSDGGDAQPDSEDDADATPDVEPDTEPDVEPDADVEPDTVTPDELEVMRWGGRLYGYPIGLTRVGRELWIGTNAVIDYSTEAPTAHGGLGRLSLGSDTTDPGVLKLYVDELPTFQTFPEDPPGPVPTAGVTVDGQRVVAVSPQALIEIEGDVVTNHPILVDGAPAVLTHAVFDTAHDALWASSGAGLLKLDPVTFEIVEVLGQDALGATSTGSIAVDPATGDVYVSVYGDTSAWVARVQDGAVTAQLLPGEGRVPMGTPFDLVWDAGRGVVWVALAAWNADKGGVVSWDGTDAEVLATEGQLSYAARGEAGPFGAHVLVLGDDDLLIVGGQMATTGPTSSPIGGGLVWIDLSEPAGTLVAAGLSVTNSSIGGDHVAALAYDPQTKRTYASLMQPCNEFKLGTAGLSTITFEAGKPRFERSILSGIRDMETTSDKSIAMAIRDEEGSVRCFGQNAQGGLLSLQDTNSGLVMELDSDTPDNYFDPNRILPNQIDREGARWLVAGIREDVFADGVTFNPAGEIGVSLYMRAAVWVSDDTFWIGGDSTHYADDPPNLYDVGPRGAARVTLSGGKIDSYTHYVRKLRDPDPLAVEGLPSSQIAAIVPTGDGGVYLVSGTERVRQGSGDRIEPPVFEEEDGTVRLGGVSMVAADGSLTVLDDGTQIPDGRAAALDEDGGLVIVDSIHGMVRMKDGVFTDVTLPVAVPEGSIPRGLWLGTGGDMVVAYSTGALVVLDGTAQFLDGFGHAWSAIERVEGVLYIGTDEGLVRVNVPGVTLPVEPAPTPGALPPFTLIPGDPNQCLEQDTACSPTGPACCEGLVCEGNKGAETCVPDTTGQCVAEDAPCSPTGEKCCADLVCAGDKGAETCVPDTTGQCVAEDAPCSPTGEKCCAGLVCEGDAGSETCVPDSGGLCVPEDAPCSPTGEKCCADLVCEGDAGSETCVPDSGGQCLAENEVCSPTGDPCCAGLACGGGGFVTMCVPEDPGGTCLPENSVCSPGGDPCCTGFVCGGSGFVTMCVPE